MRANFLHEGILVSETRTKKRPSGHPSLPKFRTIDITGVVFYSEYDNILIDSCIDHYLDIIICLWLTSPASHDLWAKICYELISVQ